MKIGEGLVQKTKEEQQRETTTREKYYREKREPEEDKEKEETLLREEYYGVDREHLRLRPHQERLQNMLSGMDDFIEHKKRQLSEKEEIVEKLFSFLMDTRSEDGGQLTNGTIEGEMRFIDAELDAISAVIGRLEQLNEEIKEEVKRGEEGNVWKMYVEVPSLEDLVKENLNTIDRRDKFCRDQEK